MSVAEFMEAVAEHLRAALPTPVPVPRNLVPRNRCVVVGINDLGDNIIVSINLPTGHCLVHTHNERKMAMIPIDDPNMLALVTAEVLSRLAD